METVGVADAPFLFFNDNTTYGGDEMFYSNAVQERNIGDDKLTEYYFKQENVELVRELLQKFVYIKSGNKYKIPKQSKTSVTLVMTCIFEEHARYLPHDLQKQIDELNMKVVSHLVPKLISKVEQDVHFQSQLGKPLDPIALPVDTSYRKSLILPAYIR